MRTQKYNKVMKAINIIICLKSLHVNVCALDHYVNYNYFHYLHTCKKLMNSYCSIAR